MCVCVCVLLCVLCSVGFVVKFVRCRSMLGVMHSRRYTNVLSWEWVGCKGYVGGNRREYALGPSSLPRPPYVDMLMV